MGYNYDYVDYVSLAYSIMEIVNHDDSNDFLALSDDMDKFIRSVIATCDLCEGKETQ